MIEPFDVPGRIAAVKRHPATRWWATIGIAIRMAVQARAKFVGTLLGVVFAAILANFQLGTMFGLLAKNTSFVDNAKADLWILEVVVAIDVKPPLVVGQRVTGYLLATK